jgi:hypothetical protein
MKHARTIPWMMALATTLAVACSSGSGGKDTVAGTDEGPTADAVDATGTPDAALPETAEDATTTPDTATVEDTATTPDTTTVEDTATTPDTTTVEDTTTTPDTTTVEDTTTTPDTTVEDTTTTETIAADPSCKGIYVCFETAQCSKSGSDACEVACIAGGDATAQAQWAALRVCDSDMCDLLNDGTKEDKCNLVECRTFAEPCRPAGTKTCAQAFACAMEHVKTGDIAGAGACMAEGTLDAQVLILDIRICANANCPDMSCLDTTCKAALDACNAA